MVLMENICCKGKYGILYSAKRLRIARRPAARIAAVKMPAAKVLAERLTAARPSVVKIPAMRIPAVRIPAVKAPPAQRVLRKDGAEWQKWLSTGVLFLCLSFLAVLFKAFLDGQFDSIDSLRAYVAGYGILAPLVLIGIQAAQVVVPVLPGFLGCAVGAVLFGCMGGFLCNYIGISVGSILAFLIARRYGVGLVKSIFPKKVYEKWSSWAGKSKCFTVTLFLVMVLPLFPDDFFCYFSGITKMSTKKFVGIILLGKPWCILAYSLLFAGIW